MPLIISASLLTKPNPLQVNNKPRPLQLYGVSRPTSQLFNLLPPPLEPSTSLVGPVQQHSPLHNPSPSVAETLIAVQPPHRFIILG